ncbi:MAG: multicopper oxidase domain-containing protein [Nitrososphaera sp.]
MSKKFSEVNKVARILLLCSIVAALGTSGALISFYAGAITIDNSKEKIGPVEEEEEEEAGPVASEGAATPAKRKEITLVAQDANLEIAPGHVVKAWTFNGTMPGPPLRFTEGDNVTIKFINKTPIPHTIHFHGHHDDLNDGVNPQVMPNQTYLYNITAVPAGALMYHCHAMPTSLHIRMGMYGALIVDPKDKPLEPAKEFVMVMSEYDDENIMKFEAEYYPINGYADQYVQNPIIVDHDELLRLYVINIGTTIPYQFHLHSTTFKAYPSGLLSNEPIDAQTVAIGPGDATIIEARWEYPGTYLFHSHGFQEERGNMGQIVVAENYNESYSSNNQTNTSSNANSTSMFDWQYDTQKKLQNPQIINYSDTELAGTPRNNHGNMLAHDNITTFTHPTTNASGTPIPERPMSQDNDHRGGGGPMPSNFEISIVKGASDPSSGVFYDPSPATIKQGSSLRWTNNDSVPHTATAGSLDNAQAAAGADFDTGILGPGQSSEQITISADPGTYDYYCTLHPFMKGQLAVQ